MAQVVPAAKRRCFNPINEPAASTTIMRRLRSASAAAAAAAAAATANATAAATKSRACASRASARRPATRVAPAAAATSNLKPADAPAPAGGAPTLLCEEPSATALVSPDAFQPYQPAARLAQSSSQRPFAVAAPACWPPCSSAAAAQHATTAQRGTVVAMPLRPAGGAPGCSAFAAGANGAAAAAATAAACPASQPFAAGPTASRRHWLHQLALIYHLESHATVSFARHLWARCCAAFAAPGAALPAALASAAPASATTGAAVDPCVERLGFSLCLWIAAKLDERRLKLPTSSQLAGALGISAAAVNQLELSVMDLLDWRPYAFWPHSLDAAAAGAAAAQQAAA